MEVAIGDFFEGDAEKSGHESIDGESVGGGEDAALAGESVGVVAELDNFIRTANRGTTWSGVSPCSFAIAWRRASPAPSG